MPSATRTTPYCHLKIPPLFLVFVTQWPTHTIIMIMYTPTTLYLWQYLDQFYGQSPNGNLMTICTANLSNLVLPEMARMQYRYRCPCTQDQFYGILSNSPASSPCGNILTNSRANNIFGHQYRISKFGIHAYMWGTVPLPPSKGENPAIYSHQ